MLCVKKNKIKIVDNKKKKRMLVTEQLTVAIDFNSIYFFLHTMKVSGSQ